MNPNNLKILIVDDEPELRRALVFEFKRKGFQVFDAENGRAAFEIVKAQKPDVVLTDVRMPGGDGVELLDNIKALSPDLPVVMFITGFSDLPLEEAYDRGADAVFGKPFDRKALVAKVLESVSSPEQRWGDPSRRREDAGFPVDLHFPDLDLAIQGKVLNLGRGGMFVALSGGQFPLVGANARFQIRFEGGPLPAIAGDGTVLWVRTNPAQGPTGCGIEFTFIEDAHRQQLITVIGARRPRAFIPKS